MDTKTLHELCESLSRELDDVNEKIRQNGGSMTAGDLELVDKLTHALKSIKTTIAMMESEDDGYSRDGYSRYPYDGMSYANRNRGGNSYARRRDSMGRYSRTSYSYADELDSLLEEMRGMMGNLPEEKRKEVERFINKME